MKRLTAKERVKYGCSGCSYFVPVGQKTGEHEGWVVYFCTEEKCVFEETQQ